MSRNLLRPCLSIKRPLWTTSPRSISNYQRRLNRLLDRVPRFMRPYTSALQAAPISHIASFLVLHELTAIIPLIGLGLGFHYSGWLPEGWTQGKWLSDGLRKFSNYFGRKSWFGFEQIQESKETLVYNDQQEFSASKTKLDMARIERKWFMESNGKKILIEVATAYAITKALLPVRILFSIWATPWFSKTILKSFRGTSLGLRVMCGVTLLKRIFTKSSK